MTEPDLAKRAVYSVSSLMVYEACPLQYYYAFVLGIPPPRTAAMVRGSNVHKLIADHYRQRQLFPGVVEPRVQELFERFKESRFNLPPVASEKPFRLALSRGDVRGRIDLILPGEDGGIELVDFKSGSGRGRGDLDASLQLPLYSLAAARLFEKEPSELTYTYFFLGDGAEVTVRPTEGSFAALRERVERTMALIEEGVFKPSSGCGCYACRRERRTGLWRRNASPIKKTKGRGGRRPYIDASDREPGSDAM